MRFLDSIFKYRSARTYIKLAPIAIKLTPPTRAMNMAYNTVFGLF